MGLKKRQISVLYLATKLCRAMSKRELFKAPEVCEMAQLQPYVLRTWEAEFPTLGESNGSGPRLYRRSDIDKVLLIKQLVYGEGLTLAGARRRLEEEEPTASVAAIAVDDVLDDMARARLRKVRSGLEEIMKLLERDAQAPELTLVSPSVEPRKVATAPKVQAVSGGSKVPNLPKAREAKGRRAQKAAAR
jgi:DNA-binding transcriptional MerR regulator